MHAIAAPDAAVGRNKINKRLFIPKLLFVPAIAFALVSQHSYAENGFWDTTLEVLAFLTLMVAALGRVWTSAYISGKKNHELVVDGPYSLTRNPLYFFSLLGYLGAGLAFEKLTVSLAFTVVFVFTHWPTICRRESKLRDKFGDKYDDVCQNRAAILAANRTNEIARDRRRFIRRVFNRAVIHSGCIMLAYLLGAFDRVRPTNGCRSDSAQKRAVAEILVSRACILPGPHSSSDSLPNQAVCQDFTGRGHIARIKRPELRVAAPKLRRTACCRQFL